MERTGSVALRMSSSPKKIRLLFVCVGNICRSPTLEAVMRHFLEQQDLLDRVEVSSRGLKSVFSGSKPDPRAVQTAKKRGILIRNCARILKFEEVGDYDYIFAVDNKVLSRAF